MFDVLHVDQDITEARRVHLLAFASDQPLGQIVFVQEVCPPWSPSFKVGHLEPGCFFFFFRKIIRESLKYHPGNAFLSFLKVYT